MGVARFLLFPSPLVYAYVLRGEKCKRQRATVKVRGKTRMQSLRKWNEMLEVEELALEENQRRHSSEAGGKEVVTGLDIDNVWA